MPTLSPEALILRHLEKLLTRPDRDKVERLLETTGLTVRGDLITRNGRSLSVDDCYSYKQAVKEVYGPAAYSFARVNFVLGGCSCNDCKT